MSLPLTLFCMYRYCLIMKEDQFSYLSPSNISALSMQYQSFLCRLVKQILLFGAMLCSSYVSVLSNEQMIAKHNRNHSQRRIFFHFGMYFWIYTLYNYFFFLRMLAMIMIMMVLQFFQHGLGIFHIVLYCKVIIIVTLLIFFLLHRVFL